jgi:pseudaminic acid cytidylyltransferase
MLESKEKKLNSIAIIPARKGSKRILNKNIKLFYGKPIISYAINKAKESRLFSKIIVSTDSKKIAAIARKFGATVDFLRPKFLSSDKTSTLDVISHVTRFLKNKNIFFKYVCCIYPATPLIKISKLKTCYKILKRGKFNYVIPVSKYLTSNSTFLLLNKNLTIKKKINKTNFKKLSYHYNDTGQYYWGTFSSWFKKRNLFTSKTKVILLSKNEFVDVNTLEDWKILKYLYKKNF